MIVVFFVCGNFVFFLVRLFGIFISIEIFFIAFYFFL